MGKIQASLASVNTDFEPIPPGIYEFEIEEIKEDYTDASKRTIKGYRIKNRVTSPDQHNRVFSDYCAILTKKGEQNDMGLQQLKRYFETIYGADEVSGPKNSQGVREGGWADDQFDTDLLLKKRWRGQLTIEAHTREGETEPRRNNKAVAMEAA